VLGANDGIVSTASLVVGVAAAASARQDVLIAGVAGLVAGALSMAAGEYVSVSSQADTEQADLKRERLSARAESRRWVSWSPVRAMSCREIRLWW
jgi:VIT1/CCC1 family predicted Fe2+/Mn2+ transporter